MSETLERCRKEQIYQIDGTVDQINSDIEHIRNFDLEQEKNRRFWGYLAVGCVVAGLLGFCIMGAPLLGIPLMVIALPTFVVAMFKYVHYTSTDLDNRRYELLSGLLQLIRTDMATDATLSLRMDLRPHDHKDKFDREGTAGVWDVKHFYDPWLELQGRLLDGTKFTLEMIEKQQNRFRWKQSRSGKWKRKSKRKNASEALLYLQVKGEKYPNLNVLANDIQDALKLPEWAAVKSVTAEADSLTLRVKCKVPWEAAQPNQSPPRCDGVHLTASMFLSLYQGLNLCKAIQKARS